MSAFQASGMELGEVDGRILAAPADSVGVVEAVDVQVEGLEGLKTSQQTHWSV